MSFIKSMCLFQSSALALSLILVTGQLAAIGMEEYRAQGILLEGSGFTGSCGKSPGWGPSSLACRPPGANS